MPIGLETHSLKKIKLNLDYELGLTNKINIACEQDNIYFGRRVPSSRVYIIIISLPSNLFLILVTNINS